MNTVLWIIYVVGIFVLYPITAYSTFHDFKKHKKFGKYKTILGLSFLFILILFWPITFSLIFLFKAYSLILEKTIKD